MLVLAGIAVSGGWSLSALPASFPTTTVLVIAAGACVCVAALTSRWDRGVKVVTVLLTTSAVGALVLIGAVFRVGTPESVRVSDTNYEVLVTEGLAVIDPLWIVSIRDTRGVFARESEIACINGDSPDNSLESVVMDGEGRLVLTSFDRGDVTVTLNPRGEVVDIADPAGILGCP